MFFIKSLLRKCQVVDLQVVIEAEAPAVAVEGAGVEAVAGAEVAAEEEEAEEVEGGEVEEEDKPPIDRGPEVAILSPEIAVAPGPGLDPDPNHHKGIRQEDSKSVVKTCYG